jgi:serine/threonine protein phosphatase PrpC
VSPGPVRVSVFGKTDLGQSREHNEDTFLVADLSTVWATDRETSQDRFAYRMKEAVELANHRIYEYAREHPELRGMGTTATVAGVLGDGLWLAQIGDSRAYLARGGEIIQLTKDQTLMQRLVDAGELTQEEADQSERRNIILQALGPDPRVRVDLTHQVLRRGDTLILCSDGLSGSVKREEFAQVATEQNDLPSLCSALIDLANERGGPDNITVVAAHFEGDGLPEPTESEGVGYRVYHLSEVEEAAEPSIQEPAEPRPATVPVEVSRSKSSSPGDRTRKILALVALLCLLAALLAFWL